MDTERMTDARLAEIRAAYESARAMREFRASKRINFEDYKSDWWVAKGKSSDCFAEGITNHWRWAAMIILGLANPDDAPYTEEKPTPEIVPELIAEIDRLRAEVETARQLHSVAAESADRLLKENKRLSKDTERLDWIDANQEMFDEAWRFSDSGNMIRDIIDTERERGKQ